MFIFQFQAVESKGLDIKQCAPGPPMDIVESSDSDDEPIPLPPSSARRQSIISTHRVRRYSTVRLDHVGGTTITVSFFIMILNGFCIVKCIIVGFLVSLEMTLLDYVNETNLF